MIRRRVSGRGGAQPRGCDYGRRDVHAERQTGMHRRLVAADLRPELWMRKLADIHGAGRGDGWVPLTRIRRGDAYHAARRGREVGMMSPAIPERVAHLI